MIVVTRLLIAITASLPAAGTAERVTWHDCLDDYAQVAMLGRKSTVTIAIEAIAACAQERQAFQKAFWRALASTNVAPLTAITLRALLADEDQAAAKHVITFTNRNR